MNTNNSEHKEKMLKLGEELKAVEADRKNGEKGYTIDEVVALMREAIK